MARVYVSTVIKAPADTVWAKVRDFNGLPSWHPRIRESRSEEAQPADRVGCIRNFFLQNGDNLREQLLGLSDFDMFCTYALLQSPMAVTDYVATLRLTPVTDGPRTFIEWSAEFSCEPGNEDALTDAIAQNVFRTGFDALKRHFGE